jgi:hypothetical protein
MIDSPHYTVRYNALADVLAADQALDRLGRSSILDRLCTVILDQGLEETYGVRLLHTHHPVHAGEWMIEEEETFDGVRALTTRAAAIACCGTRAEANCWMFVEGQWMAMEYSTDAGVIGTDPIEAHPTFAAAFADVLTEAGAANVLGLCAARRRFFDIHGDRARDRGFSLLETTDSARRANILRFADLATHPAEMLIQTVWLATLGAAAECPVGGFKCEMLVVCGEDNSGWHRKKVTHERQPLPSH